MAVDEQKLVQRAQNGDGDAFQVLVHRHLPSIHHYCSRMLANDSDAADISQEVFIKLWQKLNEFDPKKAKLTTWLHKIAHNQCIDKFRQQKEQTTLDDVPHEQSKSLESDRESIETGIDVKTAIDQLPERQKSALLFCHYQGLSNKQAADILDVSVDALESLLSRARKSLKSKLLEANHD